MHKGDKANKLGTKAIFHGRGILNCMSHHHHGLQREATTRLTTRDAASDTIGFLPYRHPIVSVVGRPIRVAQSDNPSTEQMRDVQKRYIEELTR